ncbi:hypothetical protein T265_13348 [Opisthorchis viverrini]|uniref:UBA domain-containing protein n=1 Tax=Opisthorchis viverrini TaxID=6198 RepID=A0A074ZQ66_OPIVI|nr:hypothetical protein T265_13348 [Opisthorchis viverrini]KER29563.1 hypothetical protein T265_13348 [Opisthorchis viverrini]
MFTLRIAFPSVVRSSRFIVFEWSVKGPVSELTWEGLINKLCDHTKMKRGKFYVSWHDGEEYCTISTTESLLEAIRTMQDSDPRKPPTIFVAPVTANGDNQRLSAFFGGCLPEELPKDFREQVDKGEAFEGQVLTTPTESDVFDLRCAKCNKTDWEEDKFTCVLCPNKTFCADCYQRNVHPRHPAFITRKGSPFPSKILCSIKTTAASVKAEYSYSDEGSEAEEEQSSASGINCSDSARRSDSVESPLVPPIDPRVSTAIEQLREMGFEQDYSQLYHLAVVESGDVSSIVERLME